MEQGLCTQTASVLAEGPVMGHYMCEHLGYIYASLLVFQSCSKAVHEFQLVLEPGIQEEGLHPYLEDRSPAAV